MEINMIDNKNKIFELLEMSAENGLVTKDTYSTMQGFQKMFYKHVKDKLDIDAVYFLRDESGIAKIPLIYFSFMDEFNAEEVAELHRLAWNLGEAPLLFVVTPTNLKVYNNYINPRKKDGSLDYKAALIEEISLATNLEQQRKSLFSYNRKSLEEGEYWRSSRERFNINEKVDMTLISNLKVMRKILIQNILKRKFDFQVDYVKTASIVHALLSRSILIMYLEERKDSHGESVFPDNFYDQFNTNNSSYKKYTDILINKDATYKLFKVLEEKFNGDMLPLVEDEKEIVSSEDLLKLQSFLIGDADLENNQLSLWPLYDFNIIPIQLISNIYELFYHLSEKEEKNGTFYTPLHLVDTLLDEVYPWEGQYSSIRIIDPSCGSGIFLVEAYRRVVWRWMQTNKTEKISNLELTKLLEQCIFGVDLNKEAVRIASFSLSLALCDFLDPRSIWNELTFPKLVNKNIIVSDFFDKSLKFINDNFDIVVGNPPWESKLTTDAKEYLKTNNETVGDEQIAQAFAIKCRDICDNNGKICLLMPSKGLLFNRSSKSVTFRKNFFENNTVFTIINFSIYRRSLFANATAPSAAIVYSPYKNKQNKFIYYCTPKPDFSIQDARKFSIDPTDITKIPKDIINDDRIWKIAMWGSPRDLELIDRFYRTYPSLKEFIENNNMISAEGFIRGSVKKAKPYNQLLNKPIIGVKDLDPFYTQKDKLFLNENELFYRCGITNIEIYKKPHLIIRQSHDKGRFFATLLDYDAIFNHSLLGIYGDEKMLKYLCLIINSDIFTYYQLLTSRNWMVERDALEAGDIRSMPIPIPSKDVLTQAEKVFEQIKNSGDTSVLKSFIYNVYEIKEYEKLLINDAINYTFDFFNKKHRSKALKPPSQNIYENYFSVLKEVLENSLGSSFISQSYFYIGKPLTVLALHIQNDSRKNTQFIENENDIDIVLDQLDKILVEEKKSLYIRRNIRIYTNDTIFIVKPNQEKYWNFTAASRDADEIFADVATTLYGRNDK